MSARIKFFHPQHKLCTQPSAQNLSIAGAIQNRFRFWTWFWSTSPTYLPGPSGGAIFWQLAKVRTLYLHFFFCNFFSASLFRKLPTAHGFFRAGPAGEWEMGGKNTPARQTADALREIRGVEG